MNRSSKILAVALSAALMALSVSEASAKIRKKDVAIGLGVLAGAAIIAGAAAANDRRGYRTYRVERRPRVSCRRLAHKCFDQGRDWACDKYERYCDY